MNKRRLILLMLITLSLSLMIVGCSKNKEKIEIETDGGTLTEKIKEEEKEEEEDLENFELTLGDKAKIAKEEIERLYSTDKNMLLYFNDFSGRLAPDFEMTDLEGNKINLADFKGENVIIEFMGSWCPVCKETLATNNEFNSKYKDAKIISIGVNETIESMKSLAEETKLENTEYYIPTSEDTYETYDIFFVPIYFYVDKEGYVQMILAGNASLDMLIEYADKSFL